MSDRRAAFLVTPHAGGTFSVYRYMRTALAALGVRLEWVGFSWAPRHPEGAEFTQERAWGRWVKADGMSDRQMGAALVGELVAGNYDYVFVNVLTTSYEMSAAAYLPAGVRRIMIVHNITPGTFAAARVVGPYVHATAGVSPRIRERLVNRLGFPAGRTLCVSNCMDVGPFAELAREAARPVSAEAPLRVLYLGRIVDTDKGVFYLPRMMEALADVPVRLTVAGVGDDLEELKRRCAGLGDRVGFLGKVASERVPELVGGHDVLVMPSRFEGLPYTLIEGMAGGCVPVVSRIGGVTDFVVKDGQTGMLFGIGDWAAGAAAIRKLAGDAGLREKMSAGARADVAARFSIAALTAGYREVLAAADGAPAVDALRGEFEVLGFGRRWSRWVPTGVKNVMRRYLMR